MAEAETVNPFASEIIEIVAGQEKKLLRAHASVLCQSDTFKALIEGQWADNRRIMLEDWDRETVTRLLEWLYTGDYSHPLPESPATPDSATTEEDSPPDKRSPEIGPFLDWARQHNTTPDTAMREITYLSTLMAHAKLYALSRYVLLPDLSNRCCYRVLTVLLFLGELKAETPQITDMVSVIRYVYAKTGDVVNEKVSLRYALSLFVAYSLQDWKGDEVDSLMEEGGDFAVDLIRRVRELMEADLFGRKMDATTVESWLDRVAKMSEAL